MRITHLSDLKVGNPMTSTQPGDLELISDYKAGSESAARTLFNRYFERLLRLAKRRIGQRLVSRVDPEDVLQSAFRTFFVRVRNNEFSFRADDDPFKLLARLTVNNTLRQIAFHRAAKRNPELEAPQSNDTQDLLQQISANDPSPEVTVARVDEFEQFMSQLPALERQVLSLRLEGHSTLEIAEQLGTYDRKIRRILERIQKLAQAGA